MQATDVFFGRAAAGSIVGTMLANGHHSKLLYYGTQTIPADRHCEGCGAMPESEAAQRLCPAAEMIHIDIHRELMADQLDALAGPKASKKVRRMFRRSVERETSRAVDHRLAELDALMKEKPRFCPQWLWERIRGLVLRDRVEV